ncbi:MAG: hypothetical protein A3G47_02745 [Candidatus Zambryskibacteria bacterium RIFCSPLOWO2_12_FULL_39_45]|uniref:Homing endonuclease LAGLIDADG domain-containing protein n=2 Tax=Candidatus Zambryskiibacteriota TaxID=1817925 RepID=A0A1G2UQM2_9BACT|nr:MAG: LAGLIDADG homing endonuclease [Parcubacteria group bacterium GW2011_GWA2_40_14]OHA99420.1 MAG: hypothetical protein A3E32_00600 [Candidatus Zambryskibacteria bacterium RIFCSPHIGHO2_12_FULL_38_37]OHB07406.1 MAG: hypothetical protein A2W64_03270 [Candidatus Zambryskibacteria bacterium RIFCSPLOWO2_02_39_10]OHB11562.1 MAG: hypothetical protein A3I21_00375 [Candidatus Zambryskibacteria bacterium RIFCSPLOWO2_02_FULL_39_69]OHB11689.1 MAG: hypothetical protein A2Y49_02520 [Candidatus Zambryskib
MLSKEERDILIGSLLGDGCLRIIGKTKFPAFSVSHSEKQKDYVLWKYEKLKRFVRTPPWREERIYHRDRSRKTISWRFQTLTNEIFSDLYHMFYKNGTKIIPENIDLLLRKSPLALAVWLMDDGNKNHNAVFLNTQSFSFEEQEKLSQVLHDVYGFHVTVNSHSKSNGVQLYRIRIDTESTKKLKMIIKSFILPQFYYKIPNFSP